MPIHEYQCTLCSNIFEQLELPMWEVPTPQCPSCPGVGERVISAPSIVYSVFDESATHKLPDWKQKMAQAEAHDARVRRHLSSPLPHDKGQDIKVYETEFGNKERKNLERKAQLDNMG